MLRGKVCGDANGVSAGSTCQRNVSCGAPRRRCACGARGCGRRRGAITELGGAHAERGEGIDGLGDGQVAQMRVEQRLGVRLEGMEQGDLEVGELSDDGGTQAADAG